MMQGGGLEVRRRRRGWESGKVSDRGEEGVFNKTSKTNTRDKRWVLMKPEKRERERGDQSRAEQRRGDCGTAGGELVEVAPRFIVYGGLCHSHPAGRH
jgi:hypothetical protein